MKNKILTFLLSLAIACGLWLYVITVISPGSEKTIYDIPVNVQGKNLLADRDLIITNEAEIDQKTVTLELAGNRIDLNKLNSSNIMISLDISNISDIGKHSLSYDIVFPGEIANNAVSTQKRTPGTITVNVEKLYPCNVRVEKPEITAAPGYYVDWDSVEYDEYILIYGTKQVADKIAYAKIAPMDNESKDINESFVYELYDENDSPLTQQDMAFVVDKRDEQKAGKVAVSLRIYPQRTINLKPEIIPGGGITEADVEITYSKEQITVYGTEERLDGLEDAIKEWKIDLATVTQEGPLPPFKHLLFSEVGYVNKADAIKEVTVELHFKSNIRTKTVTVTDFKLENVPDGMEATVDDKSLEVTIRGPKAAVDSIQASDLTAVVDFNKGEKGTVSRKVEILIGEKFPDVGVLPVGKVTTTLKTKQPAA